MPFELRLELLGIGFQISSPNKNTGNRVGIVPGGLQADNPPSDLEVNGQVIRAEVAHLNMDRSPELYVPLRDPAPDQRGALLAVSANQRRSLSLVTLPDLSVHSGASIGYRGHDELGGVENGQFGVWTSETTGTTSVRKPRSNQRSGVLGGTERDVSERPRQVSHVLVHHFPIARRVRFHEGSLRSIFGRGPIRGPLQHPALGKPSLTVAEVQETRRNVA